MNQALATSLHAAHEPIPAVAVSAPNLPLLPLGTSVSTLPSILVTMTLDRASRKPGKPDPRPAACRANAAHLPRDAHARRVGVPTRAATFPGTGLSCAGGSLKLTFSVMEVG